MSAVLPFSFEDRPVRVIERDGEPWFVATDVCAVLEHVNSRQATSRLDDDERSSVRNPDVTPAGSVRNPDVTPAGGNPNIVIINESGLYSLILTSRKPAAKRFKKWVTAELLPTLRRTGRYEIEPAEPAADDLAPIEETVQALRIIDQVRRLFGPARARAMWGTLPLPKIPELPDAAFAEKLDDTRSVKLFLTERTAPAPGEQVPARHLHDAYRLWCLRNDEHPVSSNMLGRIMTTLGYRRRRAEPYAYLGIALKPQG